MENKISNVYKLNITAKQKNYKKEKTIFYYIRIDKYHTFLNVVFRRKRFYIVTKSKFL